MFEGASLTVKLVALGALLTILGAGYYTWHHSIYMSGYDAAMSDAAARVREQQAADQKHKDDVGAKIAPIQDAAQQKLDISASTLPDIVQKVQVIVHDNPTFAACVRPPELDRVRQTQLEALRAESAAGPFPAGSGATQLPAARGGDGQLADGGHRKERRG